MFAINVTCQICEGEKSIENNCQLFAASASVAFLTDLKLKFRMWFTF